MFACASMDVPACCKIFCLAKFALSAATSTSKIWLFAACRLFRLIASISAAKVSRTCSLPLVTLREARFCMAWFTVVIAAAAVVIFWKILFVLSAV